MKRLLAYAQKHKRCNRYLSLRSIENRTHLNIPSPVLDESQVKELCERLVSHDDTKYLELFRERISPGVDNTSRMKASFLNSICTGETHSPLISKKDAVRLLGTMQGGYNVAPLVHLLSDPELGSLASYVLSDTILIFDYFHDVAKKADDGCVHALATMQNWANATWFTSKESVPEKISATVFKVTGETNTDDLSPAQDAWSRPDIPLHSLSMLKNPRSGIIPDKPGEIGPLSLIEELRQMNHQIAFVGDVVGTGSSRKSATNSILWHFGKDIPHVPNKKFGGICIGGKIAPIFFNTMEDSGALPLEMQVDNLHMGDVIDIYPYKGITTKHQSNDVICTWSLKHNVLLDSVQAGGRINLIIGKSLTNKARDYFGLPKSNIFRKNEINTLARDNNTGFTLAQKMVGKACGVDGVFQEIIVNQK